MSLRVEPLAWDSTFFGFGVGRLQLPFGGGDGLGTALLDANKAGLRLVYVICEHSDADSTASAAALGGVPVDDKRTYALALRGNSGDPNLTVASDHDPISHRQLRFLAWQSAEHSRFRIDHRLPAGAWRRLYSIWIRNSLNGKIADVVLVERLGARIAGMVTLAHRNGQGRIGLLAVDHDARRRGLGRRLLQAAAARCFAAGCSELFVVTQGSNSAACSLYEAAGFTLVERQSIFHFWSEPK